MSPLVPQVRLDAQGTEGSQLPCPRARQILRQPRKAASAIGDNGRRESGQSSDIAAGKVPGVPFRPRLKRLLWGTCPWRAQRQRSTLPVK